ncbi:NAD(P)H-binding protein [uncultured Paracoccus sp.]|uniref:SDR family oxidoreductase n=1 Tax=uncultured Paracoccus sp. TaxID=189685 RepID=UPI00262D0E8E|nr:NAD(P)H-binding protein [uncultured Paracoccus sp.]
MKRTILVTGARGKTGREVVRLLAATSGITLRAGASQPGTLTGAANVQPVRFDWSDPQSWPAAVDGVDAIYLMRPDLPEADFLIASLIALAPGSHIVLLSEQGADRLPDGDWVRRVERAVEGAAQSWTILRPNWFQQDLTDPRFYLDAIRQGRQLPMPSAGASIAWVDARDIAAVAVTALLDPAAHDRKNHTC